ncbi:nucleoid-associated protein [Subsaxibacter sp. CAU 1640]|uniref:nucleoid-associated protein n=1 Tax=Subsaxibacter sp. CAU 1640 TaxID=2933271 RepID=UPI0020048160|nr:nucleoid-associated protein [Subsaxibacter sp. CAU 1640]MCK7590077.1 nucleoid-associated protein [Subsaxibacter sp. CAU 1640]
MQNIALGTLDKLIIHKIGNKNNGDGVRFSEDLTNFDNIEDIISKLITSNFKFDELHQFHFLPNLELNPVFTFVSSIFDNDEDLNFIDQTKNIGRYLYDKSTHHQIKSGEIVVFYLNDCRIDDEIISGIGIFKSENKETILTIQDEKTKYGLKDVSGMNTHKLDKGCLIFNVDKENGYLIAIVDNTNKSTEAQYWKDEFLSVKTKKNEYLQTNQFLGITKQFVTKELDKNFEVSKADKIDFLNRSVDYFKKHNEFDKKEFEETVFGDSNVIDYFREYDERYRKENELESNDHFEISPQAVKKQARVFKSVLRLDKNFHIYIHGDRNLIEQGTEKDGRKFYKIYYKEEN